MRNRQFILGLGMTVALSASVIAQQGGGALRRDIPPQPSGDIERSAINFAGGWSSTNFASAVTRVIGSVIDLRNVPVANARLQLRNLGTGLIVQQGESDGEGEYEFVLEESGTYVVEMIMVDGYVVALSNAGSLGRFETLQTVVQLPGRWDAASRQMVMPTNVTRFFGMSAETSMTAATVTIAIDQNVGVAESGEPVSPTSPSS
jgi:hypothetical protein